MVQRYAPELNVRIRRELKPTNGSWRTDETYVRVAGRWTYLYRVVDSTGATIDFLLSKTRDLTAARNFFQKALASPGHITVHHANAIASAKYSRKPVRCQAITVAGLTITKASDHRDQALRSMIHKRRSIRVRRARRRFRCKAAT